MPYGEGGKKLPGRVGASTWEGRGIRKEEGGLGFF